MQTPDSCSLRQKIEHLLSRGPATDEWRAIGCTKELYVELSEPIVRQAVPWQDQDGRITDPFEPDDTTGFPSFTASRFVGALGSLIGAGRCLDLAEVCARSLDVTCSDLFHAHEKPVRGAEFYPKELMRGYLALRDGVDRSRAEEWARLLGGYDPERTYTEVLSKKKPEQLHNFVTFLEPFAAPNCNGIYRVGCFRAKGDRMTYAASVSPKLDGGVPRRSAVP